MEDLRWLAAENPHEPMARIRRARLQLARVAEAQDWVAAHAPSVHRGLLGQGLGLLDGEIREDIAAWKEATARIYAGKWQAAHPESLAPLYASRGMEVPPPMITYLITANRDRPSHLDLWQPGARPDSPYRHIYTTPAEIALSGQRGTARRSDLQVLDTIQAADFPTARDLIRAKLKQGLPYVLHRHRVTADLELYEPVDVARHEYQRVVDGALVGPVRRRVDLWVVRTLRSISPAHARLQADYYRDQPPGDDPQPTPASQEYSQQRKEMIAVAKWHDKRQIACIVVTDGWDLDAVLGHVPPPNTALIWSNWTAEQIQRAARQGRPAPSPAPMAVPAIWGVCEP